VTIIKQKKKTMKNTQQVLIEKSQLNYKIACELKQHNANDICISLLYRSIYQELLMLLHHYNYQDSRKIGINPQNSRIFALYNILIKTAGKNIAMEYKHKLLELKAMKVDADYTNRNVTDAEIQKAFMYYEALKIIHNKIQV
jgi:hypothetical protein